MDWLLTTPQIHSTFSSLGSLEGDTYVVSPNVLAILEEINYKLTYEDQTLRTFRRAVGFGQNIRSDLIPLLENAKDEAVLDSVIRILVNLTVPVECLFSVDVMYRTEVGRHTIYDLNQLLYHSKEAFTDPKSTKPVVEYMKHILESDTKLSSQKCDKINNCLLLLRNILHIPEHVNALGIRNMASGSGSGITITTSQSQSNVGVVNTSSGGVATLSVSMQNSILWNLFIQSIDKLLLYLMTCPQRAFWGVTMVQLIALMYKDQHVSTLQKLLNLWFEASLSESSEDNESNTSPPKQGSGDSSPMLTSDPTSDSSDNGSGGGSKNDSCEDRRREETEATLQEVSRLGQKYQNSIIRAPSIENAESLETKQEIGTLPKIVEQSCTPPQPPKDQDKLSSEQTRDVLQKETPDGSTETTFKTVTECRDTSQLHPANQANTSSYTTTVTATMSTNTDAGTFKAPPPAPIRAVTVKNVDIQKCDGELDDATDVLNNVCKKVPHTGQFNLTKGKCCPQKRECPSSQSELSDCGYGTQVENQESISTSSNDDDTPQSKPPHQKPPCSSKQRNKQRAVMTIIDTKELRRKKLVKRSKSSLINMKSFVQHIPTDEDISKILKEFTVDFLLKGYGYLVEELHKQLLTNIKVPIDTSHFFWLVTYFLKFAAQLELDMEHISTVLTYDVISFLTYEGVMLCEQLELNSHHEGSNLKPYLRRMHLVVTAIREFLQAIETYKKVTHLSEDDQQHLRQLQHQISTTEDLRCLFVLLLRRFNPSLQTKQYLQDLVVTNHILLLILDNTIEANGNINICMTQHISQFATAEIMHYYGMLLEDFDNNGEFVNDCIFTMMHHIGGDLEQIGTLFQPVILKTYSRIWEADYNLCDDWSDLIEYVIHKFMNTPPKSPLALPTTSLTELTKEHNLENTVCTWVQEEMDTLYWYYVQSKKDNDIVGKIVTLFHNNGNKQKSRISIIQQLLQQDIITLIEYDDLMKFEDAEYQRALLTTPTSSTTESGIDVKNTTSTGSNKQPSDDIQILRDLIVKEKNQKHLVALQKLLLECCYVKLTLKKNIISGEWKNMETIMEPVAYHCILKNKSIPLVQWNNEQATTMLYQPFVLLLHKLGFQLPADAGSFFARIPDFWTADTMFNLAKKLGPLNNLLVKFDVTEFEANAEISSALRCTHPYHNHIHTHSHHYQLPNCKGPRASLSSISSFEADFSDDVKHFGVDCESETSPIDATKMDFKITTTTIAETEASIGDVFAVPKAKLNNSIIRLTPDSMAAPYVPNWLQLVMRSKCNLSGTSGIHLATSTTNAINDTKNIITNSSNIINTTEFEQTTDVCMFNQRALSTLVTAATPATLTTPRVITPQMTTTTLTQTSLSHASITTPVMDTIQYQQQSTMMPVLPYPSINNVIGLKTQTSNETIDQQETSNSNNNTNNTNSSAVTPTPTATTTNGGDACDVCGDELPKKQLERNDSNSSGYYSRIICGSSNLENEYSAMVDSVYENENANSDCASVASDLTRMYVSDEDERHEFQTPHYH